jgi:hypothetical protein
MAAIGDRCRSLAASLVVALLVVVSPAFAQQLSLADAVKAAQVYKFASFVAWPDSAFVAPEAPMQLCVVGNPVVAAAVARAATGQTVNGRPFAVRDIAASGAGTCHILYLSGVTAEGRADIIAELAGRPVLTVTDDASGADRGVVNFVVRDNRVRFEIDNAAAARNGLSVSSRLLALAVTR